MSIGDGAPSICWFRRDLRVADHPALVAAATPDAAVVCLFVVDPTILARRHHHAPSRLRFLRAGLAALDAALRECGGRLTVRHGDPAAVVPAVATEVGARSVHVTREISPLGRARDAGVARSLAAAGVGLVEHGGDLLVEPEDLPGSSGGGYRVFTPFHRAWRAFGPPAHVPAPDLNGVEIRSDRLDLLPADAPPLPAGPDAARERIVAFIRSGAADDYAHGRDDLSDDGVSHLGPYLRFGMCTAAQVGRALGLPGALSSGREAFWRQIAWREFFHHLMARHPVAARRALQPRYRAIRWDDPEHLDAWIAGRTGYPLVDAAMRQLACEGWIHNRARMVAASFLVKDLLIDWRIGERVFMQGLVDGDPANNNGGWQWVAGTGTDAAPYFRVLSPVRQGQRFDPAGAYVRRFVPELRGVPDRLVHEPWRMTDAQQREAECILGRDYPWPVVDHAERRHEVLARYRDAMEHTE